MDIEGRQPADVPIGWIGTGVMGASMCGHLMDAGHPATVHTRTRAKAEGLLGRGAAWADSPRQVAEASEVIFTIVGYPSDVREVILGSDGALAGCGGGEIIVDMTTSEPSLAVEIAESSRGAGRVGGGRPRLRRRRGSPRGNPVDHDRGRRRSGRLAGALLGGHGPHLGPPGRPGRRPAHQDGEPDAHRRRHDQRLRGTALRLAGRAGPRDGDGVGGQRGGGQLVALPTWAPA